MVSPPFRSRIEGLAAKTHLPEPGHTAGQLSSALSASLRKKVSNSDGEPPDKESMVTLGVISEQDGQWRVAFYRSRGKQFWQAYSYESDWDDVREELDCALTLFDAADEDADVAELLLSQT